MADIETEVEIPPAGVKDADPWTIKYLSREDRNAAIDAAKRARSKNIAEWLSRAIRNQVQAEHRQSRSPTVIPTAQPVAPATSLESVERMINMAKLLGEAQGSLSPRSAVARTAARMLRAHMDAAIAAQAPPLP